MCWKYFADNSELANCRHRGPYSKRSLLGWIISNVKHWNATESYKDRNCENLLRRKPRQLNLYISFQRTTYLLSFSHSHLLFLYSLFTGLARTAFSHKTFEIKPSSLPLYFSTFYFRHICRTNIYTYT